VETVIAQRVEERCSVNALPVEKPKTPVA